MQYNAHRTADPVMSRIYYRDGRVMEYPPELAFLIWLAAGGTAIRVAGDSRPVMPWEYCVEKLYEEEAI